MAEYGSMLVVSLLAAILFLGAWNGPIPVASLLGLTYANGEVWGVLGNLLGVLNVLFKGLLGVTLMMWVRWTLPRLRIDQVMTTCWKYCTPIACVMAVGVMLWQTALPGGLGVMPTEVEPAGNVREVWSVAGEPAADPAAEPTAALKLAPRLAAEQRGSGGEL